MSVGYNCSVHGWQPDVSDCPQCELHGLITEYQNLPGQYSSALSEIRTLKQERDSLRAALKECAEALQFNDDYLSRTWPHSQLRDKTTKALSNPLTQSVLKESTTTT